MGRHKDAGRLGGKDGGHAEEARRHAGTQADRLAVSQTRRQVVSVSQPADQ